LKMEIETGEYLVVMGDRGRLRQVIGNIIRNAVEYTEKGSVKVRGRVGEGDRIIVEVEDSGRGIDEEEMKNLFDPYLRKESEGKKLGGLGIGLALTRLYVELHGGQIRVQSQPGKGSIFSFSLAAFRGDNNKSSNDLK
jgi:signal transduction histidine kinase